MANSDFDSIVSVLGSLNNSPISTFLVKEGEFYFLPDQLGIGYCTDIVKLREFSELVNLLAKTIGKYIDFSDSKVIIDIESIMDELMKILMSPFSLDGRRSINDKFKKINAILSGGDGITIFLAWVMMVQGRKDFKDSEMLKALFGVFIKNS